MTDELTIAKAFREEDTSVVVHELVDPFGELEPETVKYRKIWGGLAWPTEFSPAYACFVGQIFIPETRFEKQAVKEPLLFLSECQSDELTLEDFLQKVTDESVRLCADKVYANLGRDWSEEHEQEGEGNFSGYVTSFRRYLSDKEIPYVTLEGAPYVDNYLYSVQIINDFRHNERFTVPENTTAFDQLSSIKKSDLQNNPEAFFYAVEAVRHVIGAYSKYRPGPSLSGFVPDRHKRIVEGKTKMANRMS
jgi:hypothetical protein